MKQSNWIFFQLTFILVCVIGGLRLCFIFAALEKIPMALVHTILNGSPVVVMILGHFFLKDPCNILRYLVLIRCEVSKLYSSFLSCASQVFAH